MAEDPIEPTSGATDELEKKEFKFIRWDDSGIVARLTLNRPKQNVMNIEMLHEIVHAIESLSGAGRCADDRA